VRRLSTPASDSVKRLISRLLLGLRNLSPVIILAAGIGLLYLFISVGFFFIISTALGVIIGSVIGILVLFTLTFYDNQENNLPEITESLDERVIIILASTYITSIIILYRFYTYNRPVLMYLLFGGYTGIIGYQITAGGKKREIIPQVLILGFFTYWSAQFLFPAGMWNPDTTYRYLPAIEAIFTTNRIPASEVIYAGHLAYVAEFALVSGLSAQTAYYLLATLALCVTVPLLGILDRTLPSVPVRLMLYAAVVFSIMSWMIGRGMRPNKLNFFYPLILLTGIVAFKLFQSSDKLSSWKWFTIGVVVTPAIVFGHQFSAGAGMFLLMTFGVFVIISRTVFKWEYHSIPRGAVIPFVLIYLLEVIGNPIHQEALLERFTRLIASVVQSSTIVGAGGGPGRFSQVGVDILIRATLSQLILFSLAVAGAIWLIRKSKWEYDFVLFWIGSISLLLLISILQNTADTAPQRFYSLLLLFGLNICAGALLYVIDQRGNVDLFILPTSIKLGRGVVVVFLILLAVTSLASPIADRTNSSVRNEVPHVRHFDTHQLNSGEQWTESYVSTEARWIIAPSSDVPIQPTGRVSGTVDISGIEPCEIYIYSSLSNRTGVVTSRGLTLGARNLRFVTLPPTQSDGQIYTNGETSGYLRQKL